MSQRASVGSKCICVPSTKPAVQLAWLTMRCSCVRWHRPAGRTQILSLKMLHLRLQGHLTAEQEQALSALRARFPESAAFHSDYDLLRYMPCCVLDVLI